MVNGHVPQSTLKHAIECTGVGIHSGHPVRLVLRPAPADTGVVFVRTDLPGARPVIPARFDLVSETRLGTTLTNAAGDSVHTVEHLMAALAGLGVDNVIAELDGPEVPIMDGSAGPFVFLIECAGLKNLAAPRRAIRVKRHVAVADGDKMAELLPADRPHVDIEIDFASAAIQRQTYSFDLWGPGFKGDVARARTFGFRHEVEYLQKNGFARGGSLDNSVVIDGDVIMNDGGLRYANEFARHKLLDAVGDLALAGAPLLARFRGLRSGHTLNNRLLRALFAAEDAFEIVTVPEPRRVAERVRERAGVLVPAAV